MTTPIKPTLVDEEVYDLEQDQITDIEEAAKKALEELEKSRKDTLLKIKDYIEFRHPGPYVPKDADDEYRLLAKRAVDNWVRLIPKASMQCLFVEGHRLSGQSELSPAWQAWQRNRLDSRQSWLYWGALTYGQAYVAVGKDTSPIKGRTGLAKAWLYGPLDTTALYEDPVNDERPALVVHILTRPADKKLGTGVMWDREHRVEFEFDEEFKVSVGKTEPHGFTDTPVIPFTPYRDLEGQPWGQAIELLRPQDAINQTKFDLLVVQTYGAFKIRYVTGMVAPPKRSKVSITYGMALARDWLTDEEKTALLGSDENLVIGSRWVEDRDTDGNPIPQPIQMSPKDLMVLENEKAQVGSLPETPLDGYIKSKEQGIRDLAAQAQLPVHLLSGNIANLSADALAVAEGSFWRMIQLFEHSFGESWEQVMQLFAECDGLGGDEDFDTEVAWRDMTSRAMSQVVDALGKGAQMMNIPPQALWSRFPGVTGGELRRWEEMFKENQMDHMAGPEASLNRSISPGNRAWANSAPISEEDGIGDAPP